GAMMHIAMFDVINSYIPAFQPYLSGLPTPDPGISPEAAAAYAAHQVLIKVYPQRFNDFDAALQVSLEGIGTTTGETFGRTIGDLVVALRTGDGSQALPRYTPGNKPGDWRPTGSGDALTPQWPCVTPFTPGFNITQFRPPLPGNYPNKAVMLRSAEYAAQLNEVKRLGSATSQARTPEQTQIAFFWANDIDGTYKPPGHLYRITQIVAQQRNLSLIETARLFALVGIVLADAGIVAWDAKYSSEIDLWRPESAVRLADTDGNLFTEADPNWQPLSVNQQGQRFSPPFPAYVSGHATFGAAHSGIMRNFFGTDNVTFTADTDDPSVEGVKRTFNSFTAAALENARSRVYLGVHFQWDGDHGFLSGSALADFVFAQSLQPV
ncbi:vanadium-dependent haloperoxidase, partial [Aphanothece sacrum]